MVNSPTTGSTMEKSIYETMAHSQISDTEMFREAWIKMVSSVTAGVIENFKQNPELLKQVLADSSYATP